MKQAIVIFSTVLLMIGQSSCIIHTDQGPHGRDGRAYFGVDYSFQMPYSYWDNNPDIPLNPHLGEYYETFPGTYEFEYFINPFDYWYGTYSISIDRGTPGGPYLEPGLDGRDSFLMLYCDPDGWHEDFFQYPQGKMNVQRKKDHISIKLDEPGYYFELEMHRTDILNRRPQGEHVEASYSVSATPDK